MNRKSTDTPMTLKIRADRNRVTVTGHSVTQVHPSPLFRPYVRGASSLKMRDKVLHWAATAEARQIEAVTAEQLRLARIARARLLRQQQILALVSA